MGTGIVHSAEIASNQLREDPVAGKRPGFRFHLRQLFLFVAAASAVMATLVSISGPMALALVTALVVVGLHVFSTALGHRLRSHADSDDNCIAPPNGIEFRPEASESHSASVVGFPSTNRAPWHTRGSTPLDWLPKLIVTGVVAGGLAGATLMSITLGSKRSLAAISVGSLSVAVMGGWLAFLAGGCYAILRHGIRHAAEHHELDEQRRRRAVPR